MTEETIAASRLARCLACRGKIKVDARQALVDCPLCGLTLVGASKASGPAPGLPPLVAPRAGQDDCWKALADERRLPTEPGATQVRSARLLLAPFWRLVDDSRRSVTRPGLVVSGADLSPVGIPRLTMARRRLAGLEVEPRTRTGDAMGRLQAGSPPSAVVVDVTLGPQAADPPAALAALGREPDTAGGSWWQLVYYPVWSFHYVVYDKEHFHAVDAVGVGPIGPARRPRVWLAAASAAVPMAAAFLALAPFVGASAALGAWLVALASLRLTVRAQRSA